MKKIGAFTGASSGVGVRSSLLASVLLLSACGGGGSDDGGSASTSGACADFDCGGMLENLADNVMIPAMEEFQAKSAALESAVEAYQANNEDQVLKLAAQQAWDEAMLSWQSVEVMQTGPLIDNSAFLRDSLYSWPSKSSCAVDQEVIEACDRHDIAMVLTGRRHFRH